MNETHYLACDLAPDSGRIMLGTLSKGQLTITEVHAFSLKTQVLKGHLCWDLTALKEEVFAGIEKAAQMGLEISGLSADSSNFDYVLLDARDRPLQFPTCPGDGRSAAPSRLRKMPLASAAAQKALPALSDRTLFQIEAENAADPALFKRAQRLLPIADYLNTLFSGIAVCEESLASTTQLYNPQTHAWSPKVVAALDLPGSILPDLVPSGTAFGPVVEELRLHPALVNTRVVATCSHHTAAAVAAIPAGKAQHWAYLYSDGRSQFGVERETPVVSSQAREWGFSNEVGLGGSIRLMKNGFGSGAIGDCRRAWEAAGQIYSESELIQLATDHGPARSWIVPDATGFQTSGHTPEAMADFCRETGQPVPQSPGEFVRVILESLALAHGETLRQIEALTGEEVEVLHIVGHGSRNRLFNQLVADAVALPVVVGPDDAAAIGNVLVQALALWHLKSPDHLRGIVSSSFSTEVVKARGSLTEARDKYRVLSEQLAHAHSMAA